MSRDVNVSATRGADVKDIPPWDTWEMFTHVDATFPSAGCSLRSDPRTMLNCPSMPCQQDTNERRPKLETRTLPYNVCVARSVNKAELARVPAAQKAMQVEWDRLRSKQVWDQSVVREWDDVALERPARQVRVYAQTWGTYLASVSKRTVSSQKVTHPGSTRDEWSSRGTESLTKTGNVLFSRTWKLARNYGRIPWCGLLRVRSWTLHSTG